MPAVVRSYVENKNFSHTLDIQKQILLDYEEDARKYAEGLDQGKIMKVYRCIPSQLAKENKKFQYNKIEKMPVPESILAVLNGLKIQESSIYATA